jgi:hypothetical protein
MNKKRIKKANHFRTSFERAYGMFCTLRNLGFSADDIFVGAVDVEHSRPLVCLVVQLRDPADPEHKFNSIVADMTQYDKDEVTLGWADFSERIADGLVPDEELQRLVDESIYSRSFEALDGLMSALVNNGFAIPNAPDFRATERTVN